MQKSEAEQRLAEEAQRAAEAFAAAGVSAEQVIKGVQELSDAAIKMLSKTKPQERIVEWCACAICHKRNVTLLKREGAYICGPCYKKLLTLRALEKQQQKEQAEI